jgi:membrane associated rhomboid family serine protease
MMPIGDEGHARGGFPLVNLLIIAANLAVFFLLQLPSDAFTMGFSAIPKEITTGTDLVGPIPVQLPDGQTESLVHAPGPSPIWLTLVTSMFMHGGFAHIAGNMLFLFVFGDNVEHAFGALLYTAFYLVCGVIASLAHVLFSAESVIPSLGASGAISGVLAGYLVLFPRNRVRVLIGFRFVTEVPALVMIGLWAAFQFVAGYASITESAQTSGVAYLAHVGGFVAGLVLAVLLRPFADRGTSAPAGAGLLGRRGF